MKIYKVEMITSNPSADKEGYFLTEKEVDEIETKWENITKESPDYYGDTYFNREEIELGIFD
jgi:hypothetical protein